MLKKFMLFSLILTTRTCLSAEGAGASAYPEAPYGAKAPFGVAPATSAVDAKRKAAAVPASPPLIVSLEDINSSMNCYPSVTIKKKYDDPFLLIVWQGQHTEIVEKHEGKIVYKSLVAVARERTVRTVARNGNITSLDNADIIACDLVQESYRAGVRRIFKASFSDNHTTLLKLLTKVRADTPENPVKITEKEFDQIVKLLDAVTQNKEERE